MIYTGSDKIDKDYITLSEEFFNGEKSDVNIGITVIQENKYGGIIDEYITFAKVLDEHILAPLGFTRKDAWLCDLLPETRLNPGQVKVLKNEYEKEIEKYGLNEVTIPKRPSVFCDSIRCEEILAEIEESKAELLVLLGDIPIKQFLNYVTSVNYTSLQEYKDLSIKERVLDLKKD